MNRQRSRFKDSQGSSQEELLFWSGVASTGDKSAELCQLPGRADVVVLGGGIMGVSTAYWLALLGYDVVTIESRRLGSGASGRNSGFMLCGGSGLQNCGHIQSVLAREEIEAEFEHPGHLALATSHAVLDKMTEELAERPPGSPELYVLDHGGCEDVVKLRIAAGYLGGRWLPSGGTIHPLRFLHGLVAAARRRGALFFEQIRAQEIKASRIDDTVNVITDHGTIKCRHVVVACNARSGELLPGLGGLLTPTRGQVMSTTPMKRIFNVGMAVDWGTVYWRQTNDGSIVLGGYRGRDYDAESTPVEAVNPQIQTALEGFLPSAFQDFPSIAVAARWAGIMDQTPDQKPIVGQWPANSGVWVIAGFGGHGLPPALGVTEALANSISCSRLSVELESLTPARFSAVPIA